MSQWQIFRDGVADAEQFDDGIWAGPGEDGFTTDHVRDEMKSRGADGYSYIGRSTQVAERTEAEIAPRADAIAEAIRDKEAEAKRHELAGTEDIEAAVAKHIDELAPDIEAAARAVALKDMGLAE
jgi:hypothetical protein